MNAETETKAEADVEAQPQPQPQPENQSEPEPQPEPEPDQPTAKGETEESVSMAELDEYLSDEYDYEAPRRGDIIEGTVVSIEDAGVVMDIGAKQEGLVPASDLDRLAKETRAAIEPGEKMPVFVINPRGGEERPVLSIHQAKLQEDWIRAEKMMEAGEIFETEIRGYNRGGALVAFGRLRGFIPASHVVGIPRRISKEKRRKRLEALVGRTVGLKVIEVDRHRRRLILSQRKAFRAWQKTKRKELMDDLEVGDVRTGRVSSITDFGAFVDLGGADGLVHISELSWEHVDHPSEVVSLGDEVEVTVLKLDRERKRIGLSMKKLQADPWDEIDQHYREGQLVEATVTRVLDFGAFMRLEGLGIEGLLHAREMIGTPELEPDQIVEPGETLPVKISGIDTRRRRLDLSARRVSRGEWERWMAEQQRAQMEAENAAAEAEPEAEPAEQPTEEPAASDQPEPEPEPDAESEEAGQGAKPPEAEVAEPEEPPTDEPSAAADDEDGPETDTE